MKTLLLVLLACGSVVFASDRLGSPRQVAAVAKTTADKAAPAKKDDAASKKKEEPPAKIEGIVIDRGERGLMGLQVVDGNFKLSFFDPKKKPMKVDVASAVLMWDPRNKIGKERVVLTPSSDGLSLTSARSIRPPYTFRLSIVLLKEGNETDPGSSENYVIDFQA